MNPEPASPQPTRDDEQSTVIDARQDAELEAAIRYARRLRAERERTRGGGRYQLLREIPPRS